MRTRCRTLLPIALALLLLPRLAGAQQAARDTLGQRWEYDGQLGRYTAEVVATGLRVPFGLSFLPDGRALVSDRPAASLAIADFQTGRVTAIEGGPAGFDNADGGLLDVLAHPGFAVNGLVYFAWSEHSDSGGTTVVERARLRGTRLVDRQRLFAAYPAVTNDHHMGARLALRDGYLFIALGERDIRALAQELWTDHGKIIRLFEDGRVPPDNPFLGRAGARPGIWSYGHRNPHGLAFHPRTGELWETEHGPLGGDEVNIIRRGGNYGWPLVTFGREYNGFPIDDAVTELAGTVAPRHHYDGSAALTGLMFYTGDAFPQWRGNAFVGALTPRYLGRLVIEPADRPVREERLLLARRWRVRVVQQGPDGFIYLGVERSARGAEDGMIVRLRPGA